MKPMPLRDFLNLFTVAALFGAACFWPAACSSKILATERQSFAPTPTINHIPPQTHLPVKPGASYERESPCNPPCTSPLGASVALSRGVRHEPGPGDRRLRLAETRAGAMTMESIVRAAAHLCGVDPDLYWSQCLRESGGRHWDKNGNVLTSWAGAVGVAQVKPSTLRELSGTLDPMQPFQNAVGGACLLRQHFDRHVKTHPQKRAWRLALKDYLAGRWRKSTSAATVAYADDILGSAQ